MTKSNIQCRDCGKFLTNVSGLGDKTPQLVCGYIGCPSNNRHHKCPDCGEDDKAIEVKGLGDKHFACNVCGKNWKTMN